MTIKTGLMAAALLMLAGCNAPSQHAAVETCKADSQMQQTTLYFGLNLPGRRLPATSGSSLLTRT